MKNIILALSFVFLSMSVHAATLEGLIKKFGKPVIMEAIAPKIHNQFTIYVNGVMSQTPAPNKDYVTATTLSIDLARAGITVDDLEKAIQKRSVESRVEEYRKTEESEAAPRRKAEDIKAQMAKLERLRQEFQRRQEEDQKYWAEASDEEKQQFAQAIINGQRMERKKLAQSELESRQLKMDLAKRPIADSSTPIETFQQNTDIFNTSVKELVEAYDANSIAADQRFKGKRFNISGEINSINTDIFNNPYITFANPHNQFMNPAFHFNKSHSNELSTLNKGQYIWISCVGSGDFAKIPHAKDCEIIR